MTAERLKITYATLRADNEELHALYEAGLEKAKGRLGAYHRNFIDGAERDGDGHVRGPLADRQRDPRRARSRRAPARTRRTRSRPPARAQPAWFRLGWEKRLEILKRAAELISERQMEYGGLMAIEVGKTRLEALGEVEEAADLIRYYAKTAEDNAFYDHPMDNLGDAAVHTRSILRPHGVFAVISPFNFPMALVRRAERGRDDGRQHGRVQARDGRRDVRDRGHGGVPRRGRPGRRVQPRDGPRRHRRRRAPDEPGHRRDRVHGLVRGRLRAVPQLLEAATRGRASWRWAARTRRSCSRARTSRRPPRASCARRSASAARSARPTAASTSSAPVHDELVRQLVEKTEKLVVGDPLPRTAFMGPVIDERAVNRHQQAVAEARRDGTVFTGGERLTDGVHGPRLLRGADGRGAAGLASAVPGRAVRAVHRGRRRSTRSTRRCATRTTTCTA